MTADQCPVGAPVSGVTGAPVPDGGVRTVCPVAREANGRLVPYITPLKGETLQSVGNVVARPDRLGVTFSNGEGPGDRDRHGALWMRTTPPSDGRPIPLYRQVHPRRAAEAMLDMRCQVCFQKPDRTREGILFFVEPDAKRRNRHWPETEYTHHPPVCLPCAHNAMLHCSFVRHAPALRVRNPRPWGIDGLATFVDNRGTLRLRKDDEHCAYDNLRLLPWMIAIQPVARLSRCTVVDIHTELAAAGLKLPESAAS